MRELLIYLKLGLTPILTALLLMLNACSRSFVQEEIFSDSKDVITDIQVLEYMGYDLSRMVEYEDYYLIGDETVSKQRVEEVRNDRKTRVPYRQDQKLNQDCQEIVLIPSGQYESQIREAAEEWNKLYEEKSSNIQFGFSNPGRYAVEFVTNSPSPISNLSVVVDKPYKGVNSTRITLNLGFDLWQNLSIAQIKYLYMHALGHLVGLGHALDYGDELPSLDYWHAGDLYDPTSIMMNESGLIENKNLYTGFSISDKKAISTLYPYIAPTPVAPTFQIDCSPQGTGVQQQNLDLNTEYEFTATYDYTPCPNPTYQFTVTKAGRAYPYTDLGNGKIRTKFTETGTYTITAEVTNSTVQPNRETKIYNVVTPKPIVEGPATVELGKFYDFKITYWNPSYPNIAFNLTWVETLLKTGQATVQKVSNTLFRIHFDEPGKFRIFADITNGPSTQEEVYNVEVYYKAPYYKIEKIEVAIDPTKTSMFQIGGIPPSAVLVTAYGNYIRFYADEACLFPLELEHSLIFDLILDYTITPTGISGVDVDGACVQKIVSKGLAAASLPQTEKYKIIKKLNNQMPPSIVNIFIDPFYTISYPENVGMPVSM